jgi:hypothetical protein
MIERDVLSVAVQTTVARIGSADLVVGLLECRGGPEFDGFLPAVRAQVASLPGVARTVVACAAAGTEMSAPDEPPPADGAVVVVQQPLLAPGQQRSGVSLAGEAEYALFSLGRMLRASACVVLAPGKDGFQAESVTRLAGPLLAQGLDLVTACYARSRLGGLINTALVYPLVRSLYGKRVRCLIGSDFALSSRLAERRLMSEPSPATAGAAGTLGSLVCDAITAGLQVGQAHVGPWRPPAPDGTDLSSVLVRVVEPLFLDMERHAAFWQKMRASQPVPTFGEPETAADEAPPVDVADMIRSCQLGCRNLQEVWGVILPPATLLELRKLGRAAPDAFAMPDELWVRIVFDFALGHRMRIINRDHLLRSLTPLYLGWVASFVRDVGHIGTEAVEQRVERLCATYEHEKPYLLSRWRWPDRFNP